MSTVIQKNNSNLVFTKGAPDFLLKNCGFYLDAAGKAVPITDAFKNTLLSKLKQFAEGTLRTLLLAYKEKPAGTYTKTSSKDEIEKDLIIIGMVGIKDPIRQQVPHAVQLCYEAGVKVRMITGDNPETAVAIAKEAGILPNDYKKTGPEDLTVMTGEEFRKFVGGLDEEEKGNPKIGNLENFKKVRDQLKVLARSSPSDKFIMATGLK